MVPVNAPGPRPSPFRTDTGTVPRTGAGSLLDRARRVTRAVPRAVACRRTAAHIWGLHPLSTVTPEAAWPVEVIAPAHVAIPGCVTHVTRLPARDITEHDGVRVTTPERTALDCAAHLPRLDAVALLDRFLRAGVDLDAVWRRSPSDRVHDLLSLTDRGAASPRESWLRVILVDGGLPRPATQIRVPLPEGRSAYLDLGWEPHRLAVEYDGRAHHTTPADRRHDETRRDELRHHGWRIIVVGRDVIPAHSADLLENVANALIERGWRPTPDETIRILSRIRALRRRPALPHQRRRYYTPRRE